MAKDAQFFSHDYNSRNDPKLVKLFSRLGHAGIGIFWSAVELLFEQGGYLQNEDLDVNSLSLRCDPETLKSVFNDFGLFHTDGQKTWSDSALRRIEIRNRKSESASKSAEIRWERAKEYERNANALQTQSEGNATQHSDRNAIKERKGNKGKEINLEPAAQERFDRFWDLYRKKVSKDAAMKAWGKLSESEQMKAIAVAPAYVIWRPDPNFRKDPSGWINGKMFNDEMPVQQKLNMPYL